MHKPLLRILTSAALLSCATATAQAAEFKAGDFLLRARAISVIPQEDATISGAVTGSSIDIDTSVVPEFDVSYFITKNIALELIAAVTPHDVNTKASSSGPLDLGDVWLLPPTLTAQYHFTNFGNCKPYIGAGVNYTVFFNESAGTSVTNVDYSNSFGPAAQAGVDYMLNDHWLVNLDVKKVWISTDVKFNDGAIAADVDINPWIIGVGVGYKF